MTTARLALRSAATGIAEPDVHSYPDEAGGVVDAERLDPEPAGAVAEDVHGEEPTGPAVGMASLVTTTSP